MSYSTSSADSIATLDIEASGIHAESYPIEVGVVLGNGESWCSLIKPMDSWTHWSLEAEKIHGISREELFKNGKNPIEVANHLNEMLKQTTAYSDCWVLDKSWLSKLFHQASIKQTFRLMDMMYTMSEEEYEKLQSTKQDIFAKSNIERHRASNDARILQIAYKKIKEGF